MADQTQDLLLRIAAVLLRKSGGKVQVNSAEFDAELNTRLKIGVVEDDLTVEILEQDAEPAEPKPAEPESGDVG